MSISVPFSVFYKFPFFFHIQLAVCSRLCDPIEQAVSFSRILKVSSSVFEREPFCFLDYLSSRIDEGLYNSGGHLQFEVPSRSVFVGMKDTSIDLIRRPISNFPPTMVQSGFEPSARSSILLSGHDQANPLLLTFPRPARRCEGGPVLWKTGILGDTAHD